MELALIVLVSFVAGWVVNLAADTLPGGRPLRLAQVWDWPIRQFRAGPTQEIDPEAGLTPRPLRSALVWIVATGLGWLALRDGFLALSLLTALYAWFFLAVAVIDLEHRRVLNVMLLALLPVALGASLWLQNPGWGSALAGGLLGFVVFLVVALARPGGMGMGDVKLAGAIGLVTGLSGVLTALTIGILAGGVGALYLVLRQRLGKQAGQTWNSNLTMAYAPYLVLGVWVAIFW